MAINCDAKIVLFEHIRHIKPAKAAAAARPQGRTGSPQPRNMTKLLRAYGGQVMPYFGYAKIIKRSAMAYFLSRYQLFFVISCH